MPICKVSSKSITTTTTATNPSNLTESVSSQHLNNTHANTANNTAISATETNVNLPYPRTIQIRLEPRNEHSYCKVHRLAQNPYLNIEIETQQSVKFLLEFIENKWKDRRTQFVILLFINQLI